MSRHGFITLECDREHCHGEIVLSAADADVVQERWGLTIEFCAYGWRMVDGTHICPVCVEADRDAAAR